MTVGAAGDPTALRASFVDYLRQQLVGPVGGDREVLTDPPDRRYLMGTLYPREAAFQDVATLDGESPDEQTDSDDGGDEGQAAQDPVSDAGAWLPSSLGLSFFTDATDIRIRCWGGTYSMARLNDRRQWTRDPLRVEEHRLPDDSLSVFSGRGEVRVRRRPYGRGHLITVALVNSHVSSNNSRDWAHMLFQVGLEVRAEDGQVLEYPSVRLSSQDEEEQELRLQYRHAKTYSIGHGCATKIVSGDESGSVTAIATEVMPEESVASVRASGPQDLAVLSLAKLSDPALGPTELADSLSDFVRGYRSWFEGQVAAAAGLESWGRAPAQRILERIDRAIRRMERGIVCLVDDQESKAFEAFRLANRAMALQMRRSEADLGGARRRRGEAVAQVAEPNLRDYRWRPFQLAYFLMVVEGLVREDHPDREVVDLIWFPTGGGKTEAYLFVAAFEIILRRLSHGEAGGGTTVISRYTLSLLTTQQFQRAASIICALEYLRRGLDTAFSPALGEEPITIGLWVGEATTPNKYSGDSGAEEALQQLLGMSKPDDRFLLERCPWCGTEIVPRSKSQRSDYGIKATSSSFRFHCTNDGCAFSEVLPVSVVDDHLYEFPPTFLLGTVDKFARLAWERRAGALFSSNGRRRPSLIIQDELHLLSGPLGTTVGLYEAAISELCAWDGIRPKIIASTATIRRAGDQVRGLYGRPVQLFPPAGLDARYSYFSEPDPTRAGRLYLGVMAQGHTNSTAIVHTTAAMAQAPVETSDDPLFQDAYWTLVAYHHSLRELGRTVTLARDDVGARLKYLGALNDKVRSWSEEKVEELTANLSRAEQPRLLERLEISHPEEGAVSFLASTNMLSVGIDVRRLSLMLMMGQPKTTSEYIQATSRVGRHRVPGLVVTMLRPTKPRDRSHYEAFGVYHQSLYRHVEPTSVTPWSLASRQRALHGCLVILFRHGLGLSADDQAGEVLHRSDDLERIKKQLLAHVGTADPHELAATERDLNRLITEWIDLAQIAERSNKKLRYTFQGRAQKNLIKQFGRGDGLWETLNSMRNVDNEALVKVRGEE
ncbi:helicase-related protein [Planotetraspora phitsanulokensis]|uniref:DNA helicase n=1 Tax=Planotetraspora phitsanulokensis TaxID=575192 RepID=A0A8J3XD92_9ACTN|nr:helicase-related protein [Planotetraspora phitsanulokensis]GII37027.1 DNA helicase [Planotetraspora phitsanulokensis]